MTEEQLEQETLAWLAGLCNTLLPRLVSGQLRLPEALPLVEDAFT